MDKETDFVLSDEAIAAQETTAHAGDDLRANIAESLGLDDDEHGELLDKLTERESKLRSGYGELLGKKYIPLKKAYQGLLDQQGKKGAESKDFDPDKFRAEIEQDLVKRQNEEYLDESDFSDEFKEKFRQEIDRSPGKSARSVLKNSEWLQFYKEKEEKNKRVGEAAKNGTSQRGSQPTDQTLLDKFNDPKYMATEEGRKAFDEWSKNKK